MCRNSVERYVLKGTDATGVVPTVPGSDNHKDGSWLTTDIYKGELFFNFADGIMYTRGDDGIEVVGGGNGAIKEYLAIISQSGISAPTQVLVVKNTIGTVTWAYDGVGDYALNSAALFTDSKTLIMAIPGAHTGGTRMWWNSSGKIKMQSFKDDGTLTDVYITKATVHIIVLP